MDNTEQRLDAALKARAELVTQVVSVESMSRDDKPQWTVQVWRCDGSRLGCTARVDAPEQLAGWPDVPPDVSKLAIANCF
ncbi:MAG: hypothetical protein ABW215_23865 [Kibdelosporangium sp.]